MFWFESNEMSSAHTHAWDFVVIPVVQVAFLKYLTANSPFQLNCMKIMKPVIFFPRKKRSEEEMHDIGFLPIQCL